MLTESETMRALEICSRDDDLCAGCPLWNEGLCRDSLIKNALHLLKCNQDEKAAMKAHIDCLKQELCHKDEKIKRLIDEDSTKKCTIQTIVRTTPGTFMCDFDDNAGELLECFNLGFKVVMVQPWFDEKGRPMGNEYILEAERKVRKDGDNND